MTDPNEIKSEILRLTREYSKLVHGANRPGYEVEQLKGLKGEGTQETHQPINPSTVQPTSCPYAGRVFTEDEVEAAVSSTLDFWLTLGPEGEAFQNELAAYLGVKTSILTNSGSSANLLAISALTSHKIPDSKRLKKGDEVITCAAGFPTTVAPILQNGLIPVFLDNDPDTANADLKRLEDAYVPGKTKAVMMAHTLGNPFDLATVCAFCHKYDLWLIEDNCDALGSTYTLPVSLAEEIGLDHLLDIAEEGSHPLIKVEQLKGSTVEGSDGSENPSTHQPINPSTLKLLTAPTGTFGDLSTQSFYPPHHLTLGEGGAVNIVKQQFLKILVESFRDWGRDCWCASGKDDTCGKRFGWKLGELPEGYDHKYIYSHIGYNIKPLDPQAAIGRVQLKKLPDFVEARKRNWEFLRAGLADLDHVFAFSLPTHAIEWRNEVERSKGSKVEGNGEEVEQFKGSKVERTDDYHHAFEWEIQSTHQPFNPSTSSPSTNQPFNPSTYCSPSWFGFMLRPRRGCGFTKEEFAQYLEEKKIGNRMLFGGNLTRQPAFVQLKKDDPDAFRVVSSNPSSPILTGADRIMREAIFIGVYPGLTQAQLQYMVNTIRDFVAEKLNG